MVPEFHRAHFLFSFLFFCFLFLFCSVSVGSIAPEFCQRCRDWFSFFLGVYLLCIFWSYFLIFIFGYLIFIYASSFFLINISLTHFSCYMHLILFNQPFTSFSHFYVLFYFVLEQPNICSRSSISDQSELSFPLDVELSLSFLRFLSLIRSAIRPTKLYACFIHSIHDSVY